MSNTLANIKFRELLLPTILIAMALNITAIVDSIFVSTFIGDVALAAIEILEPIILLVTVFEWLFGLGGQILSLNRKAEFDEEGSNLYFTVAVITTVIVSVVFILICFIDLNGLITFLHSKPEITPYVQQYAPFLFLCFPVSAVLGVLSQYIRVDGQPNFATAVIIIANVVNIILNYIFLSHFHMGITGVSLASFIGYSVGLLCVLKYYFDSKRTFKFIHSIIPIKKLIKSAVEICKIGFPSASMGLFDVILVYFMNFLIGGILGANGLVTYSICVESLLIISILIIGIADTLTSIIPVYYSQDDYRTVNSLIQRSVIYALLCAVIFTAFIWITPQTYLTIYNLQNVSYLPLITNALRIYSLLFIPSVFGTILIFYYEAIERASISTVMSVIVSLVGPLAISYLLYPIFGVDIIWASFAISCVIAIIVAMIYAKIIERNEPEYKGVYFIKKGIIENSKTYKLSNINEKSAVLTHLSDLNVDKSESDKIDYIINKLFEENDSKFNIEVLIINYDSKIKVNIKDQGKRDINENIKNEIQDEENLKHTHLLGFNNLEYTINKS